MHAAMISRTAAIGVFLAVTAVAPLRAAESVYEYRTPSRDGIGKVYMGREISQVMGHRGAGWLERRSREREERTDLLIERLPVEADDLVADIGAGTGYFSFPIAARVREGKVIAVDLQPEMLAIMEEKKATLGTKNLEIVRGAVDNPNLPVGAVDLIFIVDAYHEFSHPLEMGQAIFNALKPGGKLVLIEYRAEDPAVAIKPLHKMTKAQAQKEMAALGLVLTETGDYLPQQHVLIFSKRVN